MSPLLVELREQALGLPPEERQNLVDDLVDSLQSEPLTELELAWLKEVRRRDLGIQEGKVRLLPHDQFFQELQQELGW